MKRPIYFCILVSILICCRITQATVTTCLHPDVPENGNYSSQQSPLKPGDEITYSCMSGFALSGAETRKCKIGGHWTDHTPFCDPVIKLKNPTVGDSTGLTSLLPAPQVIDGVLETCYEWLLPRNKHMTVQFAKELIIRTVKIFLKKGPIGIKVLTSLNQKVTHTANYNSFHQNDVCIVLKFESEKFSDAIQILVTENQPLTICEIEVYGKIGKDCELSPVRKIPHGHLEVSRSKAVLICNEGYRTEGNSRLVCEVNNTWIGGVLTCEEVLCNLVLSQPGVEVKYPTSGKLSIGTTIEMNCIQGYKKSGGPETITCQQDKMWTKTRFTCVAKVDAKERVRHIILAAVGVVVMIVIIALLATIIYFIRNQKVKEVVVVYQPKSEESAISQSGREYDVLSYERLDYKAPELPATPRPMAKLSTMSRGGDVQSTAWKATFIRNNLAEKTGEPMKPSTIYGN